MEYLIHFPTRKDHGRALLLLVKNRPVACLPQRSIFVTEVQINQLDDAGIKWKYVKVKSTRSQLRAGTRGG